MISKRTAALLLILCLLLSILSATALAAGSFFFVAVDDAIPLTLGTPPHSAATGLYVPYNAFDAAPNGVVPAYNANDKTLVLYNKTQRLTLDLERDQATDENGGTMKILTTYRNGVLYIPVSMASHFGLSYTLLNSLDGYPVLRFTTGNEVYDDELFIEKAQNLIELRVTQSEQTQPPAQEKPPEEQTAEKPPEEKPQPGSVYPAITNAETMTQAAAYLEENQLHGAFFFTQREIRDNASLVRELYAAGHRVGLTVEDDETDVQKALRDANEALDRVLNRKTLMVLLPDALAKDCTGYFLFSYGAVLPTTQEILTARQESILLPMGADAVEMLETLKRGSVPLLLLRETTELTAKPQEASE